jgi:hypothetical protein
VLEIGHDIVPIATVLNDYTLGVAGMSALDSYPFTSLLLRGAATRKGDLLTIADMLRNAGTGIAVPESVREAAGGGILQVQFEHINAPVFAIGKVLSTTSFAYKVRQRARWRPGPLHSPHMFDGAAAWVRVCEFLAKCMA